LRLLREKKKKEKKKKKKKKKDIARIETPYLVADNQAKAKKFTQIILYG